MPKSQTLSLFKSSLLLPAHPTRVVIRKIVDTIQVTLSPALGLCGPSIRSSTATRMRHARPLDVRMLRCHGESCSTLNVSGRNTRAHGAPHATTISTQNCALRHLIDSCVYGNPSP